MTPVEFCYWLQGAIEIGGVTSLTCEQERLILAQLMCVEPHSVFTLQTFLLLSYFPADAIFGSIKEELQKVFIHDIDPTYEGDQQYFHDLHSGKATL